MLGNVECNVRARVRVVFGLAQHSDQEASWDVRTGDPLYYIVREVSLVAETTLILHPALV